MRPRPQNGSTRKQEQGLPSRVPGMEGGGRGAHTRKLQTRARKPTAVDTAA